MKIDNNVLSLLRLEDTSLANFKLIVDAADIPIAVQIDGEIAFRLYDYVKVTDDGMGYICPGIKHPGFGRLVEIRRDDTDHFFGVIMESGEFGYLKAARIA